MSKPDYQDNPFVSYFPPGHYYSPLPDIEDILLRTEQIWSAENNEIPGINLNWKEQVKRLERIAGMAEDYPFPAEQTPDFRYYYDNNFFPLTDGVIYHLLLRDWRPARVMEIGSGFSSALLLDTRDQFLANMECLFIEPDTARLRSLLRSNDDARVIESRLQDCSFEVFDGLRSGDVLFVDSSHVSKVGSDVNEIFFRLLPRLAKGVYVHFHDIYYPFEYPLEWLKKGWAWNEAYLLRAFLQFNTTFEIILWNRFITSMRYGEIPVALQKLLMPGTGGSIWLRKVE